MTLSGESLGIAPGPPRLRYASLASLKAIIIHN